MTQCWIIKRAFISEDRVNALFLRNLQRCHLAVTLPQAIIVNYSRSNRFEASKVIKKRCILLVEFRRAAAWFFPQCWQTDRYEVEVLYLTSCQVWGVSEDDDVNKDEKKRKEKTWNVDVTRGESRQVFQRLSSNLGGGGGVIRYLCALLWIGAIERSKKNEAGLSTVISFHWDNIVYFS